LVGSDGCVDRQLVDTAASAGEISNQDQGAPSQDGRAEKLE
jgi:hypothetical protein